MPDAGCVAGNRHFNALTPWRSRAAGVSEALCPTAYSGEALAPCVRAEATLTLALPKRGLLAPGAQPYVGTLWVGDIGVPPSVWERFGLSVGALFARAPVVEVR